MMMYESQPAAFGSPSLSDDGSRSQLGTGLILLLCQNAEI